MDFNQSSMQYLSIRYKYVRAKKCIAFSGFRGVVRDQAGGRTLRIAFTGRG